MKPQPLFPSRLLRPLACSAAALALLTLGGCDNLRSAMGMEHKAPDEFSVTRNPPLVVPPDYSLRPPEPGAVNPGVTPPREQAQTAVLGAAPGKAPAVPAASLIAPTVPAPAASPTGTAPLSAGEKDILSNAHVTTADPTIRQKLSADSKAAAGSNEDSSLVDKLMFWKKAPQPGKVVDAAKEDQRLKGNADSGSPVTEGDTPVIERRTQAPFEDLVR